MSRKRSFRRIFRRLSDRSDQQQQQSAEGYRNAQSQQTGKYNTGGEEDWTSSVIIIEFTSKTDSIAMDGPTYGETFSFATRTSTTFECKTLWKDAYSVLQEFYRDRSLCDVTLIAGETSIPCHRLVLATCSPYFRAMFTTEMRESRQDVIRLKDMDESCLELLVDFMYTSRIVLTVENVQKLLYSASLLQIEVVSEACSEFMKSHLDPTNCFGVLSFAEQHGRIELKEAAQRFCFEHFVELSEHEEFLMMDYCHLLSLVSSPDIIIDDERQVYDCIMRWVRYDIVCREIHLPELMKELRLPMMSPAFLTEVVEAEDLIKKNHQCRDLIDEAKNYHLTVNRVIPESPRMMKYNLRMSPRKSTAGVLFVVGGRGSSGDPFKSTECFDLRNSRWFSVADMTTKRRHVGVTVANGKVYAVGGFDGKEHLNTMEVFDPQTNKWTPATPMNRCRRGLGVIKLGGPIYAIGGLDDSTCFSDVERYDPNSNSWSSVQPMRSARGGVAVAVLNGLIYAIGGNDGSSTLNSCECYDPYLNKWQEIAPMKMRRAGGGAVVLNGYLYAIGGFDHSAPLNSVERYNPQRNEWTPMTPMTTCRGGVGTAVLAGKLYAIGGHDGTNYLSSSECYCPLTNSWEVVTSITNCRAGAGVATCDCLVSSLKLKEHGNSNLVSCV